MSPVATPQGRARLSLAEGAGRKEVALPGQVTKLRQRRKEENNRAAARRGSALSIARAAVFAAAAFPSALAPLGVGAEPRIVPSCDSDSVGRVGPISGAPLPRFESLRAPEANLRRGPSFDHAIDWVIRLPDLPICVISEIDGWRRVELPTGERGWLSAPLVSERRFVLFVEAPGGLWAQKSAGAEPILEAPAMTPMRLGPCDAEWCAVEFDDDGFFARRARLWGVRAIE